MTDSEDPYSDTAPEGDGASRDVEAEDELVEEIEQLPSAANAIQRAMDEQRDRYLRLAAEYDNFRKRSIRERSEAESRGQGDLVKSLLEALDDLSRFAHVDPTTVEAKAVVEGAAMVERKLLKALSNKGLEIVDPSGLPFNPERHEALTTVPAATPEEDGLVAQTYQPGYVFNGQLLRPARVVVKQWNG